MAEGLDEDLGRPLSPEPTRLLMDPGEAPGSLMTAKDRDHLAHLDAVSEAGSPVQAAA